MGGDNKFTKKISKIHRFFSKSKTCSKTFSEKMSNEQEILIMGESQDVEATQHPHNNETILKDANLRFSPSEQIKYWVDENNSKCFMIFPRKLSITWSDDPNYWTWFSDKESSNEAEATALKNVCWLDITGKFDTRNLTPGITYEVVFKVKLEDPAYGWETPVNLKLVLPNSKGKPQEKKLSLREQPRHKWVDIRVGEFVQEKSATGEITFSMYEHESGAWKKGLFLKGVAIRPKYNY